MTSMDAAPFASNGAKITVGVIYFRSERHEENVNDSLATRDAVDFEGDCAKTAKSRFVRAPNSSPTRVHL